MGRSPSTLEFEHPRQVIGGQGLHVASEIALSIDVDELYGPMRGVSASFGERDRNEPRPALEGMQDLRSQNLHRWIDRTRADAMDTNLVEPTAVRLMSYATVAAM